MCTPDTVIMTASQAPESQQLGSLDIQTSSIKTADLKMFEIPNSNPISKAISQKILESSDEENEVENFDKKKVLKKKKPKRIVLSDDEESEDENTGAKENEDEIESAKEEDEAKEIMYDSEENEIEAPAVYQGFRDKKGRG